jgi:uncharacterized membrane protein
MDDVTIARALHVVSVILWIGGVGFVTTVLLPSVRRLKAPHERMRFFDAVERRFAWQARIWTVLVGLTRNCTVIEPRFGPTIRLFSYVANPLSRSQK